MATTKKITADTEETIEQENTQEQKGAINLLDLLLGADVGEIKLPTKQMEITRLTEVFGAPFVITCKALSPDKFEEVQDMAVSIKGKDADIEVSLLQLLVVMEGVVDNSDKPMFKNKDLMAKFKAPSPKELVKKLLLSGEITQIYQTISSLSGFGENAVKEIKN
jgi:hypothetical protein